MGGPKSSSATIAARQLRLNDLLLAGKTVAQAGEVLRAEGFPASHDVIENDEKALSEVWRRGNAEAYDFVVETQYTWLQQLKLDLKSNNIKDGDKISLALAILDREMRLIGTEAPSRSVSAHVNMDADVVDPASLPAYRRWLYETRFMDAATKEKAFALIRSSGLNVRVAKTINVPTSSPLWGEPKQLEVPKAPKDSE